MFIVPFLVPIAYSLKAYKHTCIGRVLNNDSEEYNQLIKDLPGYNLKTELKPFFDKIGVRKDLIVTEKLNLGFCTVKGTNFFTKSDAILLVPPNFQNVDKGACHWLMKHETCHIKNNDCFTMPLVPAICSIAAAAFSTFLMPVIPALLVTISIGIIAQAIFSQYREGKADDLAIAESSVEELKGGRRFLMAAKAANLETRKTKEETFLIISPTGENRLDILHPSLASRLRKIEHALQQQNITIDDQEESEKIDKLKNFIYETNLKLATLGLIKAMNQ